MSDIDFDELDRAVNGVLGGTAAPAASPASTASEEPVITETPTIERVERTTLSPISSSSYDIKEPSPVLTTPPVTIAPLEATPVAPVAASTAPAARRSSGRFMDMVHPSSDMRSRTTSAPVENKPVTASVAQPEPVAETPQYNETPAWNEPLESPFLADAKVEKRPLGGGEVQVPESKDVADTFDFQGLLDEPDEELLEAPEPQERLEATTMPDPIDFAAATAVTNEVETAPVVETPAIVEQPPVVQPEIQPLPVIETPQPIVEEPVGPTSITPQYKEQPSAHQETGAMYDTESYHQAVTAPVKKKSGWFTVLWILLLVIFGAGAGWAVFVYVLPML